MSPRGWLLFVTMSVIWGIPYLFIAIAVREIDPTVLVFARAAIGAIVLIPLAIRQKMLGSLRSRWRTLLIFSLIHMTGAFVLISFGEQHVSSSLASLLIAANPMLVVLLGLGIAKDERVTIPRLVGLLVGLVGLTVLLGFDVGGDKQEWLGVALLLLAALGYAIGALLIKHSSLAQVSRIGIAAGECSITSIVLLPVALWRHPTAVPSPGVWASVLILGLICTALALPIFFSLIKEVGASRATVITYVNPAVSVFLGVLVLHDQLTIAILAGFLLIIAGSWLATAGTIPRVFARRVPKPELPGSTLPR